MMRVIVAEKQVGDVSYFVKDLSVLSLILEEQRIKQSNNAEYNPRANEKGHFVSFSRNPRGAAMRNDKKWRYGLILDGTKLSNHYSIGPFSYLGTNLNRGRLLISTLTAYDDGTCTISLANFQGGAFPISADLFEAIKEGILSMGEKFNSEHKLEIQPEGKYRVQGRKIKEKYSYRVKHGDSGKVLSNIDLPEDAVRQLTNQQKVNEYEERLWSEDNYIDISGCIKGIVLPESEVDDLKSCTDPEFVRIRQLMDSICKNYMILYY